MTFGEKLKIARNNAGLKQAELAKKLNTTGNTISNWENNVSKPDLDTLAFICGILNVKASYFLEAKLPEDEVTLAEFNIIKKYRDLDEHGKEMFDFTLQKEWERSTQPIEGHLTAIPIDGYLKIYHNGKWENYKKWDETFPELNAANDRTDIKVTEEMKKEDDSFFDED